MKKRFIVFLLLFSCGFELHACFLGDLFNFLTCGCCCATKTDEELLSDFRHRMCYERGLTALLSPIKDHLLALKDSHKVGRFALVFDLDGVVFYPASAEFIYAIRSFYQAMQEAGFFPVFISSRCESDRDLIRNDLRRAGYDAAPLVLMSDAQQGAIIGLCDRSERYNAVARWKALKRAFIEVHYGVTIVATLDDQMSNLTGEHLGIPIWIPGYLELKKRYVALSQHYADLLKKHE